MSIAAYLRDIGRGREGARSLDRAQACDLMGALLDGRTSDLEAGAFCMAMRMKGETAEELVGFLDAVHARITPVDTDDQPTVILPSYNGARRLPVLTPLLALLLARQGMAVIVHGQSTEGSRVSSAQVLAQEVLATVSREVQLRSTTALLPGLGRLLAMREVIGVRNTAHTLVKLLNPARQTSLLMVCHTHPEYRESMAAALALTRQPALLFRGTEGEPVFDARRRPRVEWIHEGERQEVLEAQEGPLRQIPSLCEPDAPSTARWIRELLEGERPIPEPIASQVALTVKTVTRLGSRQRGDACPIL